MKKLLLASTALAFMAMAGPAFADAADWNFGDHTGLLGNTQTFTSTAGGFQLTARGFTLSDVGTRLFSKTDSGDERGLGLNNDPSGNTEISFGNGFVQLNLDGLLSRLSGFQFSMGSTTQDEGWKVFGSEDGSPFAMTLLASSSGTGDEGLHNLPGGWDNYNFFYSGAARGDCGDGCNANVLLASFDAASAVPGPIVGAGLPGLIAGCMTLLGLGKYRRRRQGVA